MDAHRESGFSLDCNSHCCGIEDCIQLCGIIDSYSTIDLICLLIGSKAEIIDDSELISSSFDGGKQIWIASLICRNKLTAGQDHVDLHQSVYSEAVLVDESEKKGE